jgi:hypothetical protein
MVAAIVVAVLWAAVALIERSHRWARTSRIAGGVLLILLIGYAGMSVEDWYEKEKCATKVRKIAPNAYGDLDDMTLGKKVLAKYPNCSLPAESAPK